MLKFNLARLFNARGIERPFSYLVKQGFSANMATRIANSNLRRLSLRSTERLCCLLNCTPNDLLEWVPENAEEAKPSHALFSLLRQGENLRITSLLRSLPLEEIKAVEAYIQSKLGE